MEKQFEHFDSYWKMIWVQFKKHHLGVLGLYTLLLFCLTGVYAPFLASSKPFVVIYDGHWYFPLFRYLFYTGFYTKVLDIFFNLFIFTIPLGFILFYIFRNDSQKKTYSLIILILLQCFLFLYIIYGNAKDPASNLALTKQREQSVREHKAPVNWNFDLGFMNSYAKLNTVLRYQQRKEQFLHLQKYSTSFAKDAERKWIANALREKKTLLIQQGHAVKKLPSDAELEKTILQENFNDSKKLEFLVPSLWELDRKNEESQLANEKQIINSSKEGSPEYNNALAKIRFLNDRHQWLENESKKITFKLMALIRPFHWEEDAGGQQSLNRYISWFDLTRINRKDLVAALIFGIRISLVVGLTAVFLALLIGVPIGAIAGYYGGTIDIIVSRLLEIWESMPTFFMLLLVVAITQSKSIFLVVAVIGLFSWPTFSRYIRGEFFKQRNLPYIEACHALGFRDPYIMFSQILPNAIPPLLTLLPFAVMGAITSEAGLSFLGLGEEGSCSWGVLMDEGRTAFPGESYLLWPPAILLTLLLVAIALVGDALRDAIDPKMHI
jgi:peptide/nickel transport system permease protein